VIAGIESNMEIRTAREIYTRIDASSRGRILQFLQF
jgi:hypothetical protein